MNYLITILALLVLVNCVWFNSIDNILFKFQEEKYIKYVDGLKNMLKRYHAVITSLDSAEVGQMNFIGYISMMS